MPHLVTIRPMLASDLDFATQCTANEGWHSEVRFELEAFHEHDPRGCFIAEVREKPAGMCVATLYGECGFIGEVIVIPEARGKGLGQLLLRHAVQYLKNHGAKDTYLDGVQAAVSLYERVGFRKICRSLRFSGDLHGKDDPQVIPMQSVHLEQVLRLDLQAFGADRSFFLNRRFTTYPQLCKVLVSEGKIAGYIMGRQGAGVIGVGPCICSAGAAGAERLLLALAMEIQEQPIMTGTLESNPDVAELLRSLGLQPSPSPSWRMVFGNSTRLGNHPDCYLMGSPAKG